MSTSTPAAIGILGGTFDPIHYGHLRLAQEVAQTLSLQQVRFIPAAAPPLREQPRTGVEHRVAMVRLAIADNPLFVLDDRETRRSGLSYTVDTLIELRGELGAACPLMLILGADAFLRFDRWHRWREIFGLAHLAVAHRPGTTMGEIQGAELAHEFATRRAADFQVLQRAPAGAIADMAIPPLDISATAIRAALANGRSVRYLLPDAIIEYIRRNDLIFKEKIST